MDLEPAVADALRAIVAGTPVDWAALESAHPDDSFRKVICDLKVVSQIASLQRTLQESGDTRTSSIAGNATTGGGLQHAPTWGALTLLERVGAGSFGEVFRAWDSRLDREVALKLLRRRDDVQLRIGSRSVHEGRLLARVRHPNIITVYGADVIDGCVGIWMEFVRGRTLEAIVRDGGPLTENDARAIGLAVCRALGAVHRAGLVHRDVKAQNVMRDDDGRIVLMDFGAGQECADSGGALAGTPAYVAPEVLDGEPATSRSDWYSLGVLLFHLTTGSYPVQAPTVSELRAAHRNGVRRRLAEIRSDLPRSFVDVVEQAMAPRTADRFDSAEAFEAALALPMQPEPPASIRAGGFWRRHALMVASAVVVLAMTSGLAWRSIARNRRSRDGSGAAALAIVGGPTVRKVEVPAFIASGAPSRTGRWLAGVDWSADGNLALLDLSSGTRRAFTNKPETSSEAEGFTERSAISADERAVAFSWYVSPRQDTSELRVVDIDGSNPRTVYRNAEGITTPVAWSPDGQRVLVLRERSTGPEFAWIGIRDGRANELVRLTSFPRNISLSPDGGLIAYDLTSAADSTQRDLYVCDAVTGRGMPLLIHPANDLAPVWTPDGAGVVFSSDRSGNLGLWYLPVTRTGEAVGEPRLVRGDMGRFSPIGFGRDAALFYHAITGTVDVYVARVDLRAGVISTPSTVATRFVGTNLFLDWSRDSRRLVFTSRRGEVGFERRSQVLVVKDLAANAERVLVPDLDNLSMPRWSSDGRWIALTGEGPDGFGLYRVSAESGAVSRLIVREGFLGFPEWRADGRALLFLANVKGQPRREVHEFELGTSTERTIVENAFLFAPSRDGRRLAFARREPDGIVIYVTGEDGLPPSPVLKLPLNVIVELAGWSPDDRELVVARRERSGPVMQSPKPTEILAVPAVGGNPRRIAMLELDDPRSMRLSPDGSGLAFEAGYPSQSMWVLERFMNR